MGLPAPLGRSGPRVLESGVVIADMLEAMTMEVEVGSSTLAAGDDAVPETAWFPDGGQLAKKARLGKATVTVAALGPRLPGQALSDADRRTVESRAYELRAGLAEVRRLGRHLRRQDHLHDGVAGRSRAGGAADGLRAALPGAQRHCRPACTSSAARTCSRCRSI